MRVITFYHLMAEILLILGLILLAVATCTRSSGPPGLYRASISDFTPRPSEMAQRNESTSSSEVFEETIDCEIPTISITPASGMHSPKLSLSPIPESDAPANPAQRIHRTRAAGSSPAIISSVKTEQRNSHTRRSLFDHVRVCRLPRLRRLSRDALSPGHALAPSQEPQQSKPSVHVRFRFPFACCSDRFVGVLHTA